MAELYVRCTRAILTKMSRVLSEPEDAPAAALNRNIDFVFDSYWSNIMSKNLRNWPVAREQQI